MNWFARCGMIAALIVCLIGSSGGQELPPDWQVFTNHYAAGLKLKHDGKPTEAIAALEKALAIQEKAKVVSDPSFADFLITLAALYRDVGKPAQAEPLSRRALAIRIAQFGEESLEASHAQHELALSLLYQGSYAQTEPLLVSSLKTREAKLGKDHLELADLYHNLGQFYWLAKQYARSIPAFERCIQIREMHLGKDSEDVLQALLLMAQSYQDMGLPARAEPLLMRCLETREARPGKDDLKVADSHNNLGNLYVRLGDLGKAEASFQRALDVYRAQKGSDHEEVARLLNNLAAIHQERKDFPRAESDFQDSLRILEARLGPNSPILVTTLNNLADVYVEMDSPDKAMALLVRALQIREQVFGPNDPDVAKSLQKLAGLYLQMREPEKADPLLRRGIELLIRQMGPDHPDVATQLLELAEVLAIQGKWDEAIALADKASRLLQRHVQNVLPYLSEEEQLSFLQSNFEYALHRLLAFGLAREKDAALAALTAEWLLNHKARGQQALAERSLLARASEDPALQDAARRLKVVREQLAAALYARPAQDKQAEHRQRIAALTAQEQALASELNRAGGQSRRADSWIELAKVRASLPADAVLIEIARINPFDYNSENPNRRWQPEDEYVVWIIPPAAKGDVRVVRLGSARNIDYAIEDLQDAMGISGKQIANEGEAKAAEEIDTQLDIISVWLHQPVEEHIADFRHLLVSPDASLWFVPWAALRLNDGRYVIEKHCVSYLLSGRNVLSPGQDQATGQSMILANPDYNLTRAGVREETRKLVPDRLAATDQRAPALDNAWWSPLPGTEIEAEAITPKLTAYVKSAPQVYKGAKALETVFKAAQRPRVAILSTHGFFLGSDGQVGGRGLLPAINPAAGGADNVIRAPVGRTRHMAAGPRAARLTGKLAAAGENPLLRSGLVLSGANDREAPAPGDDDDGILTALEIVGIDLRGTELVVLSACETGLGQASSGEGVAGLRQAFQLAGARATATTLWKIPDQETADLMSAFFDQLAGGQTKADALRAAQLAMIKERRAARQAAHPFFWAAFTLTGDWR